MTAPQRGNGGAEKACPLILDVKDLRFRYPSHNPRGSFFRRGRQGLKKEKAPTAETSGGGFEIGSLNLDIHPGEVLSICGPNGSGKSTLLALLGGWLKPQAGSVRLAPSNREVSLLSARERARRIALVCQESPLLFPMTVAQFVLLGRYAYLDGLGFESLTDWEVARSSMSLLSLLELAGQRLDRISGGEKQRAILARALAQQPEVLLLDEPTANLDINFQLEFLQVVRKLAAPDGDAGLGARPRPAVVVVLHDLNLASEFSDSVLLLANGNPLRFGTPQEVFSQALLEKTYGAPMTVDRNPVSGKPRISVAAKP